MLDTPAGRLANANAQAPKVRAQLRDDITYAVVTGRAAALSQTHDPWRKIELIIGQQDFSRRNFVKPRRALHGGAAPVHIVIGLSSHKSAASMRIRASSP